MANVLKTSLIAGAAAATMVAGVVTLPSVADARPFGWGYGGWHGGYGRGFYGPRVGYGYGRSFYGPRVGLGYGRGFYGPGFRVGFRPGWYGGGWGYRGVGYRGPYSYRAIF